MYFWEAVPPDWLREIRSHQRANQGSTALPRPPTFGLPRPPIASASHILSCDLSKPIRGARPPMASHGLSTFRGADRPLTHTGQCCPILGAVWLISRLNALLHPLESNDSHGLSLRTLTASHTASHFGLSVRGGRPWEAEVGGCGRPSTASHHKVMWSVWESKVRGRVGGRSASHAHRASRTSTGQSNAFSRGSDSIGW